MTFAKYRALASGADVAIAVEKASAGEKKKSETSDEIEDALDWILGRNGKRKDPKIGIRMLCDAAKERPIAKGVFIRRWMTGVKGPHSYARGRIDYEIVVKRIQRTKSELEAKCKSLLKEEKRYLQCIEQAADMGCEPTQKFVERFKSSYD